MYLGVFNCAKEENLNLKWTRIWKECLQLHDQIKFLYVLNIKVCASNGSFPPIIFLGKVYVSHIVDYLRHTTSRSSEDSGLEELCNMLDPEHKDVSIDLDTYHAVMREWIDDCRNNGY